MDFTLTFLIFAIYANHMILLLLLFSLLTVIPCLVLIDTKPKKNSLFILNVLSLAFGVMLLSLPAGEIIGKVLYYFTH